MTSSCPASGVALQVVENLTGSELLAWRLTMLAEGGEAASFDWLLDLAAGLRGPERQHLWLDPERAVVLQCSCEQLAGLWRQHLREHTPLQYLVGLCPWRDLELQVAPGVLIPRQETEQLVDLALELMAQQAARFPSPPPALGRPGHRLRMSGGGPGQGVAHQRWCGCGLQFCRPPSGRGQSFGGRGC